MTTDDFAGAPAMSNDAPNPMTVAADLLDVARRLDCRLTDYERENVAERLRVLALRLREIALRVAQPESGKIPRDTVEEVWNLYDSASSWADFEAIHARVAAQFGGAPPSEGRAPTKELISAEWVQSEEDRT